MPNNRKITTKPAGDFRIEAAQGRLHTLAYWKRIAAKPETEYILRLILLATFGYCPAAKPSD